MKSILLLGGNGFIGYECLLKLLRCENKIRPRPEVKKLICNYVNHSRFKIKYPQSLILDANINTTIPISDFARGREI